MPDWLTTAILVGFGAYIFRLLVDVGTAIDRRRRDRNRLKSGHFDESHARQVGVLRWPPAWATDGLPRETRIKHWRRNSVSVRISVREISWAPGGFSAGVSLVSHTCPAPRCWFQGLLTSFLVPWGSLALLHRFCISSAWTAIELCPAVRRIR